MKKKLYTAIGLMSGTSMDGIDLSIITSDGYDEFDTIGSPEVDELSTTSDRDSGYKARKRGYLRRLDEENSDNLPRPNMSRHVTRRSISRELFNDSVNDSQRNEIAASSHAPEISLNKKGKVSYSVTNRKQPNSF